MKSTEETRDARRSFPTLAREIVARSDAADQRLRRVPFYRRLLTGKVTREEYADWLIQLHKYVHLTAPASEQALADAMAARAAGDDAEAAQLRAYALECAREETGHDEMLIADIANLFGVSRDEAFGRVAREADAPSVLAYKNLLDTMHARFPEGIIGVGLALQNLAILESDEIRAGLIERSGIPGIEGAVVFLKGHSGEVEAWHAEEDAKSVSWIHTAKERAAILFFADLSLALFEGIAFYLNEKHDGPLVEAISESEQTLEPALTMS